MKRLLYVILLLLAANMAAQARVYRVEDVPNVQLEDATRYVSNPDGILSSEAVAAIDDICVSLREQGLAQVAVVVVEDIAGDDVFEFAYELFSKWGVGSARYDNGFGVLLVRERREIRFLTGYGLEGALPDAICKRIQMDFMLPEFRNGDYSRGMVAGMDAVKELLESGELEFPPEEDEGWDEVIAISLFFFMASLFIGVPGLLVVGMYRRNRRCPKCRKVRLKKISQHTIRKTHSYRLLEQTLVCRNCGHTFVRRVKQEFADSNSGSSSGGGSSSRSSGGSSGGSYGGGSFGGGGAGSKW